MDNFTHIDGYCLKRKVRAIVTNENMDHLLIRPHGYDDNSWTFIGGGVEAGETDIEAVYRELREEVNIEKVHSIHQAQFVNWFTFSQDFKTKKNFDYDGQYARYFHVSVPNNTMIKLQESEVADFLWCDETRVLDHIKVSKHVDIFKQLAREFNFHC